MRGRRRVQGEVGERKEAKKDWRRSRTREEVERGERSDYKKKG
jgi:hypothetical protein